ncbi:MAG: hypothetical protein N5P05_002683 [Chroococcopsis gigantea SAG 12.99]|jgi:hypothetical protein|nr:DUF928 domain-containing protein [Chlorogloea purpurea SAG 13.99]MDV3001077.1 hypothetical protein [Chroococcopsis gigantea SAG 12.99]
MHNKLFVTLANIFSFGLLGLLGSQLPLEVATGGVKRGYIPPLPPKDRRQTVTSAGSRGCPGQSDIGLTLLAPNHHIATTVSEHPTLFISVAEIPQRALLFTLARPDISEPVVQKKLKITSPGIIPITLPSDTPALEMNKNYYWTVTIICNEKRPSENAYARSAIKRIALNEELAGRLQKEKDFLLKAQIYARARVWYDAVTLGYQAYTQDRDFNATAYFWQLLEEAGLYSSSHLDDSPDHG